MDSQSFTKFKEKQIMKLSEINKLEIPGTFITVKSKDATYYIAVESVINNKEEKTIEIFDREVHDFGRDGSYYGPVHYDESYEFTYERFKKEVSLTDQATVDKITKIKEAYLRANPDHYKRLKEMKDAVVKDPISEMFDQLTTFEQIFGGEISNADNKTMKDAVKIMQFQASMEGKTINPFLKVLIDRYTKETLAKLEHPDVVDNSYPDLRW